MRTLQRLILAGVLAAGMGLCWAQDVGDEAPDFELKDTVSGDKTGTLLEALSNRVVVIYFWRSIDLGSVELLTRLNELHESYYKRGVVFLAVTDEKKEKAESTIKGKEVRCLWGWRFDPERPYRFPAPGYAYIIDIHGRIAYARINAEDDLEGKIKEVIEKDPPPGADPESMQKRFVELAQFVANKEYGRAWTLAKEVESWLDKGEDSANQQVKALLEQIEEGARELLKEAREDIESKNYHAACAKLAEISVRLLGSDVKEDADRELARLQGDNYTKEIVRKAMDNAEAERRNDDAADLASSGRYLEARQVYREVAEEYPETEAAKAAQDAVDKINNDPTVQTEIRKMQAADQAARWCDLAERFARVGMFDLARARLEDVIKEHAGTTYADKARKRLGQLAQEEKEAKEEAERRAAGDEQRAKEAAEWAKQREKERKERGDSPPPKTAGKPDQPKPKKPDKPKEPDKPKGGRGGGVRPRGGGG